MSEINCVSAEFGSHRKSGWGRAFGYESLANLAHELRTPVQVLLGYLDMLRGDGMQGSSDSPAESDRAIIERMNVNVHELAQTVDNVLEFALAYANADSSLEEEIDLAQLFEELDEVLGASKRNDTLALRLNLDEAPRTVVMRRRPLRSIVLNLGSNAIKFTAAGEVTITATGVGGSHLNLEVRDTGKGMSRDLISVAFEPLVQLSRSSVRHHRGLGLGLTLVQHNVRSLGGRLQVESEPGVGSCFKVSIPFPASAS
jgi:signal transduction histidine kinase